MSSTDSRPRLRKAPAERAAEILAAATAIARQQGLSALTLRAIAERAGVASGLVAHYQPSMDDLVARVYTDLVEEEIADVRTVLAAHPSAVDRFTGLLDTLLDGTREDLTVVWVEGWAMSRRNPVLAAAVRTQMSHWQSLVEEIVDEGISEGSFATSDAAGVAWQLMGMVDGLNAQSLVREADPASAIDRMARAAEALLGAQPGSLSPQIGP